MDGWIVNSIRFIIDFFYIFIGFGIYNFLKEFRKKYFYRFDILKDQIYVKKDNDL